MSALLWTLLTALLAVPITASAQNTLDERQATNVKLSIVNGINRGTDYTDSLGIIHNIRYIPVTVTNDTTIPIQIHLEFSKLYDYPETLGDGQFSVIPMPTEWGLDGLELTDSMFNELMNYIDTPILNKIIEPGETFVTAIGTRYLRTGRGIVPNELFLQSDIEKFQSCDNHLNSEQTTNPHSELWLKLNFHLTGQRNPASCVLIPCGQISYPEP